MPGRGTQQNLRNFEAIARRPEPLALINAELLFGKRRRCGAVRVNAQRADLARHLSVGVDSALKDDFAAGDRQVRLDVLDLVLGHGRVIRGEHHDVRELSGLDGPFTRFVER